MASAALTSHLEPLLADADYLLNAGGHIPAALAGHSLRVMAVNRAVVVTCVSAWEAYVEELVREALAKLRPPAPPLGLWPALNATVRGQLGRFNTPNADNVRLLVSDALGLPDVQTLWAWPGVTSPQAVQRLAEAMRLRHEIAHGVNPRPGVDPAYAEDLPDFIRRLADSTDRAARDHLVTALGVAHPWPP